MRADARAHRPAASRRADRRAPPDDRASSGDAVRENAWARLAKSDAKGGSDDRMIGNTGKSGSYIPASGYHDRPIVADEFVPHSSSSSYASSSSGDDIASGGSSGSSSTYSSTPAKKAGYGLGGWKK